jgi:pyruvate/2-oxoglutarate dehydrogenase complex dihydrolipoamide dehydrogenase (E3) component/uncharacterized membrane protein YdjX (TVP38/TMEM64 family)
MRKWLFLALSLIVIAFLLSGVNKYFSLDELKASLDVWYKWRDHSPLVAGTAYFAAYVLIAALSLPGALAMTLLGGALFGITIGTILVSFASSLGALFALLVSRYLLRDFVQKKFGGRLKPINAGIAREGAFYLFTLRLVPVFPYFLINLAMGLTPMRASIFYIVSQIGMLATTILYVNAGTQLVKLNSLSGILSPEMGLSFALLGLFPWVAKRGIRQWKKHRIYALWNRPANFDRNLVVIGAGAAGLVASYIAAAVEARVTLVEANKMGGDCLNFGCVPSKALIRSAKLAHQMKHAEHYGLKAVDPAFSFRSIMARVHEVIASIAPHDSIERYTGLGVEVLAGHAQIVDPWTVEVLLKDGKRQRLTTRSIVIAAGARPIVPRLPGIEETGFVTSDTLWGEFALLDSPPQRMVVLGGGPIGSELAQAFARLGSQVSQIEMSDRILFREDNEVSEMARISLEADGVSVLTSHKALRCERDGNDKFLVVEHEGTIKSIPFDVLVCAVGRIARLTGYGLEELGIPVSRTVETNEYLETIYPNIYAAGDVAGPYQFTHTAAHQAWYATVNALFGDFKKFKVDYRVVPWTTFTDPEVARVGLNEKEANEQHIPYEVTRFGMDELDRAIADGAAKGFVKVLTVPGKDRILGVTIVGEHAGDLLAEFVLAMKHGLGLSKILGTIHTYPTLSEANKYVAGEWKRAHAPQRLLSWLERFHAWRRG